MLRRHPRALRWRQAAAPVLVAGLAGSAALAVSGLVGAAAVVPVAYLAVLAGGSLDAGLRRRDLAALLLPAVLAAMHLAWGAGFWCGCAARRG